MSEEQRGEHRQRDSESLLIMGAFLIVLAVLVLFGVTVEEGMPALVSAVAGIVLLGIGLGAVFLGLRFRKRTR